PPKNKKHFNFSLSRSLLTPRTIRYKPYAVSHLRAAIEPTLRRCLGRPRSTVWSKPFEVDIVTRWSIFSPPQWVTFARLPVRFNFNIQVRRHSHADALFQSRRLFFGLSYRSRRNRRALRAKANPARQAAAENRKLLKDQPAR